jgi:ArsR family transcriptional regulator
MAHPSRLIIIEALTRKKMCVCELTDLVGADMSTVSRHLAVLKNAGIVRDERKGTTINYILQVPCIMNFMGCVEKVIEDKTRRHMQMLKVG